MSWNEQPASVAEPNSNASHNFVAPNAINSINTYNPPNYINLPYQRTYNPSNAYPTFNGPRHEVHNIINNQVRNPVVNGTRLWNNPSANIGRYLNETAWGPVPKTTNGIKKQKRIRTAFTSSQMMELEQEYTRTRYLDRARRIELAEVLRLNERTIKIWFQNRRMKEKKDRAESLEEMEEAITTTSPPGVGPMPVMLQEQYATLNNEAYNREGVFIEQYPDTSHSTNTSVIGPNGSIPQMDQVYHQVGNCPEYVSETLTQPPYQQIHLQLQHYSSSYNDEMQELSAQTTSKNDVPPPSAPSDIIEKSWDLSWIKSLQNEEDYS